MAWGVREKRGSLGVVLHGSDIQPVRNNEEAVDLWSTASVDGSLSLPAPSGSVMGGTSG
jgi:hypothetical protein